MKVYAVIERCEDGFYPDYRVTDNYVYLKREDAEKRLNELFKEYHWLDSEIYEFEVRE